MDEIDYISTPVATDEQLLTPVATVVKAHRYIFKKKQSLEQIDPFDILHNMIEQLVHSTIEN
jgi:hypothetical protein